MAIDLNKIVSRILGREGVLVNHPEDRGGPTKYGITLATLRRWRRDPLLSSHDIAALTEQEAKAIYLAEYAEPFAWVPTQALAELVIDSAVQHGCVRAAKLLQRAVGETDDGIIGPKTRHAVTMTDPGQLWRALFGIRLRFYAEIMQRDPTQRVFAAGWVNRMAGLCG